MSLLTRRAFLQRIGIAAAALAIKIPAFQRREPYVRKGDVVSWIGHCPSPDSFIGGKSVVAVGKWDGVGYPVTVRNQIVGPGAAVETYYDVDLCNFNREVPDRFWWDEENVRRYPNVHTYVRTNRYGERIDEAIKHLNFASIDAADWPAVA